MIKLSRKNFDLLEIIPEGGRLESYQGLHITNDFTEATDGYRLVRILNPVQDDHPKSTDDLKKEKKKLDIVLDKDMVETVKKVALKDATIMLKKWRDNGEGGTEIQVEIQNSWKPPFILRFNIKKSKFANTETVVGKQKKIKRKKFLVNIDYLNQILLIMKRGKNKSVYMSMAENNQSILLEANGDQTLAVLMPMAYDLGSKGL